MAKVALEVGQTLMFREPLTDDEREEREERCIVLELRGDRVLVEFICAMSIKPASVYLVADLVAV